MNYDELLPKKEEKKQPARIPLRIPYPNSPREEKNDENKENRVIIIDI